MRSLDFVFSLSSNTKTHRGRKTVSTDTRTDSLVSQDTKRSAITIRKTHFFHCKWFLRVNDTYKRTPISTTL